MQQQQDNRLYHQQQLTEHQWGQQDRPPEPNGHRAKGAGETPPKPPIEGGKYGNRMAIPA